MTDRDDRRSILFILKCAMHLIYETWREKRLTQMLSPADTSEAANLKNVNAPLDSRQIGASRTLLIKQVRDAKTFACVDPFANGYKTITSERHSLIILQVGRQTIWNFYRSGSQRWEKHTRIMPHIQFNVIGDDIRRREKKVTLYCLFGIHPLDFTKRKLIAH